MRTAIAIILLVVPGVAGVQLDFAGPATLESTMHAESDWIFLLFDDAAEAVGEAQFSGDWERASYREPGTILQVGPFGNRTAQESLPAETTTGSDLSIEFSNGQPSSLFILAQDIQITARDSSTRLNLRPEGACFSNWSEFVARHERAARFEKLCPPGAVELVSTLNPGPANLEVRASGIEVLEVHNLHLACNVAEGCPNGPDRGTLVAANDVELRDYWYHRWSGNGELSLTGMKASIMAGGDELDLLVDGTARFPLASTNGGCEECAFLSDQTLVVTGLLELQSIRYAGDRSMQGNLSGSILAVRIDESEVSPGSLAGGFAMGATAATVGLLALLKFLVLPLFTRLSKEKALEHPRRKVIFDYIHEHPGANFREIARNTGIAAGTVRHHLNVLARSELVVERQHGSTVRLFENQARFQENWADLVLLREPPLGQLHAWLKEHPASPQKAVLEGMDAHGWSRSTTQHRLARLVEGGLATIRLQGRLKIYSVVDRSQAPGARPAASWPPAAQSRPGFNTA